MMNADVSFLDLDRICDRSAHPVNPQHLRCEESLPAGGAKHGRHRRRITMTSIDSLIVSSSASICVHPCEKKVVDSFSSQVIADVSFLARSGRMGGRLSTSFFILTPSVV
jgi:hypothetical protein